MSNVIDITGLPIETVESAATPATVNAEAKECAEALREIADSIEAGTVNTLVVAYGSDDCLSEFWWLASNIVLIVGALNFAAHEMMRNEASE